jgi:hypothetical protein
LEPYTRRTFTLHIADEPWKSGEILLPTALGRDQIWEHLQTLHTIPDISQFQIIAGRVDITKNKDTRWPPGRIEAIPFKFPVNWNIEMPQEQTGFLEVTKNEMTPLLTGREAWEQSHHIETRLYENASLDYSGKLRPGITITAAIIRVVVKLTVRFEVIRKGRIMYIHECIPNMATWLEIHTHFSSFDKRIPPYSCYIEEENRPYEPDTGILFRLADGEDPPDTTGEHGGTAGGISREGYILPAIVFPKAPIDVSKGKLQAGGTGQLEERTVHQTAWKTITERMTTTCTSWLRQQQKDKTSQ